MKVAVLANSPLALPSLHELLQLGAVAGVGVPATAAEGALRVTQWAQAAGLPVQRLPRPGLATALRDWVVETGADAVLVYTFPWRIPAAVLATTLPGRWFNCHFAPLPAYRGPEPLFWLIRNGATAGGVALHRLTAALDEGPVVLRQAVPLPDGVTHGLHQAQLAGVAAGLTRQLAARLRDAGALLPEQPQDEALARYWPRPTLPDLCIDWAEPAAAIDRLVRAANPWNRGAFATLRGQPLRVLVTTPTLLPADAPGRPAGTVVGASAATGLLVACGQRTALRLEVLALEEGYFTGPQLLQLGIGVGEVFGPVAATAAREPVAAG